MESSRVREPKRTALSTWLAVLGFMVMGLVSRSSFTNHPNSESFLVVRALFSQDGCQREGFWEVAGHVVSPFDLFHSSHWWRLISSVFLNRTFCCKTTRANGYYGAWPGWAVSISVLPLTQILFSELKGMTLSHISNIYH